MMFKLIFITFIAVFICLPTQITHQQDTESSESPLLNDSILEFFHNCTCTPFYTCKEINYFIQTVRANRVPVEINCTEKSFICCKNEIPTEPMVPTSPSTEKPPESTPPITSKKNETVQERHVASFQMGCGIAKTVIGVRILNPDTEAAPTITGEAPWIVEVFQRRRTNKPYKLKCAGNLIHEKVVLTVNHCVASVKAEQLKVVTTGTENFQNINVTVEDERNVATIIKHPDFYSGGLYNDIALLIVDKNYDFSKTLLNAICLPSQNETFVGERCLGLGWGENPNLEPLPLNKVDMPIVGSQECQNLLRNTSLGTDFNLHSSFLCAGGEGGKDTCKGDGGGPLMCLGADKDRFVLSGIVSWGVENKCGIANQPGLYTNVAHFVDWIKAELDKVDIKLNN